MVVSFVCPVSGDLENYVLDHLTVYNGNPCLFAGVKGTDAMKHKINTFYRGNRRKSMTSTILFKGNSSKTTVTQQIILQDGNLLLYVDEVIKNKTSKNKKRRVPKGMRKKLFQYILVSENAYFDLFGFSRCLSVRQRALVFKGY